LNKKIKKSSFEWSSSYTFVVNTTHNTRVDFDTNEFNLEAGEWCKPEAIIKGYFSYTLAPSATPKEVLTGLMEILTKIANATTIKPQVSDITHRLLPYFDNAKVQQEFKKIYSKLEQAYRLQEESNNAKTDIKIAGNIAASDRERSFGQCVLDESVSLAIIEKK
jgi:hypothetical protein